MTSAAHTAAHTAARKTVARRASRIAAALALTAVLLAGPAQAREAGVASAVNADATTLPPQAGSRTLVVGHRVVFDEKITTRGQGQAQLLMLDQSAITIAPNSELVIDKFVYDPDRKTGEMAISLTRGLMRFVGGRLSKSGDVTVNTPVATMGIRGGIAMVNILSEKVVDVTLLFGESVAGKTNFGDTFQLRRNGYFTRIEQGKGASTPVAARSGAVANSLAKLQGRADADGGAEEKPTEDGAEASLGETVADASQLETDVDVEVDAQAGEGDGILGQNLNDGDANSLPPNPENNTFVETPFDFARGRLANQGFDGAARQLDVVDPDFNGGPIEGDGGGLQAIDGIDPDDFVNGDRLFSFTSGAGVSLAALVNGGPLTFSLNGIGDPDAAPNIFDANDPTAYRSPQTFNANAAATFNPSLAEAVAARNDSGPVFFNYDLTSPDFDGVSGSRYTITGGVPLMTAPAGRSFFHVGGDSQTASLLPFSEVGRFRLPILGVGQGATRRIDPANVHLTPLMVDWASGKALQIGGVRQDPGGAEPVSAIQVFVGEVGGGGALISIEGANVGKTDFVLNGQAVNRFHAGLAFGAPLGEGNNPVAISLDGNHAVLEPVDANGFRQDPTVVANHQFGERGGGIPINPAPGAATETLFAAGTISNAAGMLLNVASDPNVPGGVGTFQVDPNAMEAIADLRLTDGVAIVQSILTTGADSAFFGDDVFGVAAAQNAGGAFVNGAAPALVMIAGDHAGFADACECAFMHWGLWATGDSEPGAASNIVSNIGAFFAGVETPDIQMPVSGSATFTGVGIADMTVQGDPTSRLASGPFQMNTSFATGVSTGRLELNQRAFDIVGMHNPGQAALAVDYIAGNQTVGNGHGAFFGQNARNVGVTINIDGAGVKAAGAAIGER